jgi:hypothetical protein
MWKRLPVFRFVAPFFESGVGSKMLSFGKPLALWLRWILAHIDVMEQLTIFGRQGASV